MLVTAWQPEHLRDSGKEGLARDKIEPTMALRELVMEVGALKL
jgi:hypothetical protein